MRHRSWQNSSYCHALPIEPKPSYPECTPSDVGDEQWLSCSTSPLIQNNPARHKNMFSVRSLSHLERLWVMHRNTWDLEKMMHRCEECMTAFPPASNAAMVSSFLSLLLTKWRTTTNGGDLLGCTPYVAKVYQSDLFLSTRLWQPSSFSLDKVHLLACDSPRNGYFMVFTHSFFQSFGDSNFVPFYQLMTMLISGLGSYGVFDVNTTGKLPWPCGFSI